MRSGNRPHIDQAARDLIEDLGLTYVCVAVGSHPNNEEEKKK